MAFNLGNFAVKEVLYGVAQDFDGEILYTLDQLTSAEIAVESESTDITDKNGTVIRTIYKAKTASLSATSALISPALLNAASGSDTMIASSASKISMPKIAIVKAGGTLDITDITADDVPVVMGIYGNGANGDVLSKSTAASLASKTFGVTVAENKKTLAVPAEKEGSIVGAPEYIVKYMRDEDAGIALVNKANTFPDTIRLTLYVAIMDPCDDQYRAAYVYVPSFTPDPSVTISLSSDSQEMDYKGNVNVDFCQGDKVLYYIYFPDENAVVSGSTT